MHASSDRVVGGAGTRTARVCLCVCLRVCLRARVRVCTPVRATHAVDTTDQTRVPRDLGVLRCKIQYYTTVAGRQATLLSEETRAVTIQRGENCCAIATFLYDHCTFVTLPLAEALTRGPCRVAREAESLEFLCLCSLGVPCTRWPRF